MSKKLLIIFIITLAFLFGFFIKVLHYEKGNPFTKKSKIWTISILTGDSPTNFYEIDEIKNPVLTASDVTDIEATFVADPFMIKVDSTWYMFFEVTNANNNQQGDIGLAESKDGFNWEYKQIVLDENFHLSYPLVFKFDDKYFMIPETSESYSVRIYQADIFPTKWSYKKTLLNGNFIDPTILNHDNKWWLFVGALSMNTQNVMEIFYSDSLLGTYKPHKKNPIIFDSYTSSRPAGRIIKNNDKIIRYAQITKPIYGTGINAFHINILTNNEYEETSLTDNPVLYATNKGWNSLGMHQIDPYMVNEGQWIACVDGLAVYRKWGFFW